MQKGGRNRRAGGTSGPIARIADRPGGRHKASTGARVHPIIKMLGIWEAAELPDLSRAAYASKGPRHPPLGVAVSEPRR